MRLKSWFVCAAASFIATACGTVPSAPAAYNASAHMTELYAKSDLLYVANQGGVGVYSYKDGVIGAAVFVLKQTETPEGMCTDKNGDVWITGGQSAKVFRFPHGSGGPDATIHVPDRAWAWNCSVDPTTGNLAVGERRHVIHVYAPNKRLVATYHLPERYGATALAYDNMGNLFVFTGGYYLYEIPPGSSKLQFISVTGGPVRMSAMVFTNPYLLAAAADGSQFGGYKLLISNGIATIHSIIPFAGSGSPLTLGIRAKNVIVPDYSESTVRVYRLADGRLVSSTSYQVNRPWSAIVSQPSPK